MGLADILAQNNKTNDATDNNPSTNKITSKDKTNQIKNNISAGILKLSQEFLEKANEGKIQINDTKDLKNIMSVAQILFSDGDTGESTPQVSSQFNSIYATVLNLPSDTEVTPTDITRKVSEMSAEDIKSLVDKTAKVQNEENSKTI